MPKRKPVDTSQVEEDAKRRRMGTNEGAGAGSSSDVRERFGDVYKPGANPTPRPGLRSPMEGMRKIGAAIKKRMRKKP